METTAMQEQARGYAESKMRENWDRKDAEEVGVFYKHYCERFADLQSIAYGKYVVMGHWMANEKTLGWFKNL